MDKSPTRIVKNKTTSKTRHHSAKYKITLSEKQAYTIISALDLWSRILCGQWTEVEQVCRQYSKTSTFEQYRNIQQLLEVAKNLHFPELQQNQSYGIYDTKVDNAQIAYDIYQVMRHCIAWNLQPEGGIERNFDKPNKISEHELCTMEVVNG